MTANRNGLFYTLDRTNGALLRARPFVRTTWAQEVGRDGRPILLEANRIGPEGTVTCPDVAGGTNWMSPSFNPGTGLFYVTTREVCAKFYAFPQQFQPGHALLGRRGRGHSRRARLRRAACHRSGIGTRAMGVQVPETVVRWHVEHGVGSGVRGRGRRKRDGLRRASGKNLWRLQTGAGVRAGPMSFMLNGRQYVVVASGGDGDRIRAARRTLR